MSNGTPLAARPQQEQGDPRPGVILLIAAAIVAMLLLVALATYLILQSGGPTRNSPQSLQTARDTRLDSDPGDDLAAFERAKQSRLHGYGWVDSQHQFAHVPIELAMQKLADRSAASGSQP
jgi:hypothetical protein